MIRAPRMARMAHVCQLRSEATSSARVLCRSAVASSMRRRSCQVGRSETVLVSSAICSDRRDTLRLTSPRVTASVSVLVGGMLAPLPVALEPAGRPGDDHRAGGGDLGRNLDAGL